MTREEQISLGDRIRYLREEKRMSLGDLERESGVTKGYLSQLERGEASNPSLEAAKKIAHGLDVHLSYIVDEAHDLEHETARLPAGLQEFLEDARRRDEMIGDDDVHMLVGIRYRGRQPRTASDWALLYDLIRKIVG